jgi:hypothetical protein
MGLSIYEKGRLFVLLVCQVEISQPNHSASCHALGTIAWMISKGASRWFYNVLTYGGEVVKCELFFSVKMHLNKN